MNLIRINDIKSTVVPFLTQELDFRYSSIFIIVILIIAVNSKIIGENVGEIKLSVLTI